MTAAILGGLILILVIVAVTIAVIAVIVILRYAKRLMDRHFPEERSRNED